MQNCADCVRLNAKVWYFVTVQYLHSYGISKAIGMFIKVHGILKGEYAMSKVEDMLSTVKLTELLSKKDGEKKHNKILCILAVIGIAVAVVIVIRLLYKFFAPDYTDDFEDDFEDEFEDDFFDDDEDEYDE